MNLYKVKCRIVDATQLSRYVVRVEVRVQDADDARVVTLPKIHSLAIDATTPEAAFEKAYAILREAGHVLADAEPKP